MTLDTVYLDTAVCLHCGRTVCDRATITVQPLDATVLFTAACPHGLTAGDADMPVPDERGLLVGTLHRDARERIGCGCWENGARTRIGTPSEWRSDLVAFGHTRFDS